MSDAARLPYASFETATTQEVDMGTTLQNALRHAVLVVTALLALFIAAQVAQLVSLASAVHPLFGTVVAIGLIGGIGWLVAVPLLAYLRIDPALVPPLEASGSEHEAFIGAYLSTLRRNPRLVGRPLDTEADLKSALEVLEREAEGVANRHASHVFLGTAVSQYGSLDALIVAVTQARMVWEISHVFQQRPSLRQLGYLYTNVLATSLVASRLEQVDLSEYVRPVLAGVVGQSVAAVPGVAAVSGHMSNAIFRGSINAFLTLRVAMVAIAYSRATIRPERNVVWRSAITRAGHLVIRTITVGSAEVTRAFALAAAKTVASGFVGVGQAVATGATSVGQAFVAGATTVGHGVATASQAVVAGGSNAGQVVGRTTREAGETMAGMGTSAIGAVRLAAGRFGKRAGPIEGDIASVDSHIDVSSATGQDDEA
jgi:hypothetical protein